MIETTPIFLGHYHDGYGFCVNVPVDQAKSALAWCQLTFPVDYAYRYLSMPYYHPTRQMHFFMFVDFATAVKFDSLWNTP